MWLPSANKMSQGMGVQLPTWEWGQREVGLSPLGEQDLSPAWTQGGDKHAPFCSDGHLGEPGAPAVTRSHSHYFKLWSQTEVNLCSHCTPIPTPKSHRLLGIL